MGSAGATAGTLVPALLRATRITRLPRDGLNVMPRRRVVSGVELALRSSWRERTARRTIFISRSAKLAPRQRLRPPPNGVHVYVPGYLSRKRSGLNAYCSG